MSINTRIAILSVIDALFVASLIFLLFFGGEAYVILLTMGLISYVTWSIARLMRMLPKGPAGGSAPAHPK